MTAWASNEGKQTFVLCLVCPCRMKVRCLRRSLLLLAGLARNNRWNRGTASCVARFITVLKAGILC